MQEKERKLGRIKVPSRKAQPRQIRKRCVYLSLLMFIELSHPVHVVKMYSEKGDNSYI